MSDASIETIAAVLRGRQGDLIRPGAEGLAIEQPGGVVLTAPFAVPIPGSGAPVAPRAGEPSIETFMGEATGPMLATGPDPAVADWWRPTVEALVDRVISALTPAGVLVDGPISVTASATPVDEVIAEPHLDDDQYHPDAGVGLVAIAASHRGPRLARGSLACRRAVPGAPLDLDPAELLAWFDGSPDRAQSTGADRIVLFPRFGQLHAGPHQVGEIGEGGENTELRNLLVLRADTIVAQARTGSGPT